MGKTEGLAVKWLRFWKKIGAKGDYGHYFYQLKDLYNAPGRFFHNFEHIAKCIEELDLARRLLSGSNKAEAALWFHDVVYNTRMTDNEERSAEFACRMLGEIGLPESFRREVADIILFTKHIKIPEKIDACVAVDIDLIVGLSGSFEEFAQNRDNIRKEYLWVPEEKFIKGSLNIFRRFLERQNIFSVPFFREKYEEQARLNLKREIIRLDQITRKI